MYINYLSSGGNQCSLLLSLDSLFHVQRHVSTSTAFTVLDVSSSTHKDSVHISVSRINYPIFRFIDVSLVFPLNSLNISTVVVIIVQTFNVASHIYIFIHTGIILSTFIY